MKLKIAIALALTVIVSVVASCNVTRVVTTESSFYKRGDTTVNIQTKTIETYDASKKL